MASKYPGKQSSKKTADRTPYEHEQHKIYSKACSLVYMAKHKNTESFKSAKKARDKRYLERHPDKVKLSIARCRAAVKADPVKTAKQLQMHRALYARYRSEMSNCYIKSLISKNEGISMTLITDEMVAVRRATLTIKRLIKTMN